MPLPVRWESYSPAIKNLVEFYGRERKVGEEVGKVVLPFPDESTAHRVRALVGGFCKAVDKGQLPNMTAEDKADAGRWPELYRYKGAVPRFRAFYSMRVRGNTLTLEPRHKNGYEEAILQVLLPEQMKMAVSKEAVDAAPLPTALDRPIESMTSADKPLTPEQIYGVEEGGD